MKYPKYVFIVHGNNKCALRLKGGWYYRDAGKWEVEFKEVDGKLFVDAPDTESPAHHLDNLPLIPCKEEEWKDDNKGYV